MALASGPGAFLNLLGPAVLKAREGPFPLRLMPRNRPRAATAMREARAHVAAGVFASATTAGLQIYPWREVGQMVVVPKAHRLAAREQLHPTDLAGEALVIAPQGLPHRVSTARVLAEQDVAWEVAVEATGWELMVRFVTYGMGVTVINDFVALPDDLTGVPISGFPAVRYDVATLPDSLHEGTTWLREVIYAT